MHASNDERVPDWLGEMARDIDSLARDPNHMRRFRDAVRQWSEEYQGRCATQKQWTDRRHEHEQAIRNAPRLRNEDAGPPNRNWIWEFYPKIDHDYRPRLLDANEDPILGYWEHEVADVQGWTPPELTGSSAPKDYRLLPLSAADDPDDDPRRASSTVEQYTVLAAVHDHICLRVEQVNPWRSDQSAGNDGAHGRIPDWRSGLAYAALIDAVSSIRDCDRHQLAVFPDCVEEDLSQINSCGRDGKPDAPTDPNGAAETKHHTTVPDQGYTVAALREMTELGNAALNKYAKLANVQTPLRGQRSYRYSARDARAILKTIIENSSEKALRAKCRRALQNLGEIPE